MRGKPNRAVVVEPTGLPQHAPLNSARQPLTPNAVVRVKNGQGKTDYFLRLSVTGWAPRGFGPFKTEKEAVEFLRCLLSDFEEHINERRGERKVNGCDSIYEVHEHPVALTYLRAAGHGK